MCERYRVGVSNLPKSAQHFYRASLTAVLVGGVEEDSVIAIGRHRGWISKVAPFWVGGGWANMWIYDGW